MTGWRKASAAISSTPTRLAMLVLTFSVSCLGQLAITEYPIPNSIVGVTSGPDGAVWFTEFTQPFAPAPLKIGRITSTGSVTEYTLPTQPAPLFRPIFQVGPPLPSTLASITTGPDGALWFGVENPNGVFGGAVGRITTSGNVTEAQVPRPVVFLVTGSDGAIWFLSDSDNAVHRITTSGTVTDFPFTGSGALFGMAAGPDGAIWFTAGDNKIRRITTSGVITQFAVTSQTSQFNTGNAGITAGPDGALWFIEFAAGKIGRITTAGSISEFAIPGPNPNPAGITAGPDGAMWFTDGTNSKIGRIQLNGTITEYALSASLNHQVFPSAIFTGPDGDLWFSETGSAIAKFPPTSQPPLPIAPAPSTFILSLLGVASIAWITLRRRKTTAAKTC